MNLFQPKKINYDFKELQNPEMQLQNQEASKSFSRSKSPDDRRKPVIDYKIKINHLEKEIHTIKQNFDESRTKNGYLRNELDELRKNVIINKER